MALSDWKNFLLPPVAIYATIFLFISALIGAKINQEATWVWLVTIVISIIGLYIATNSVNPKNMQKGIRYGVVWVVILVALDIILTVPFTGLEYFSDWRSYLPYALTILIPTFLAGKK